MPDRVGMDNIRTGSLIVLSRGDNPGRVKVTWVRCLAGYPWYTGRIDGLAVNCVSFLFGSLKYAPEIWAVVSVDVWEMRVGSSVGICDRHYFDLGVSKGVPRWLASSLAIFFSTLFCANQASATSWNASLFLELKWGTRRLFLSQAQLYVMSPFPTE